MKWLRNAEPDPIPEWLRSAMDAANEEIDLYDLRQEELAKGTPLYDPDDCDT